MQSESVIWLCSWNECVAFSCLSFMVQIALEESVVGQGKENLLIPERAQVLLATRLK